jgi:hypothetical protein
MADLVTQDAPNGSAQVTFTAAAGVMRHPRAVTVAKRKESEHVWS